MFTLQLSTVKQDSARIPLTFVEAVYPQPERIGVRQYLVSPYGLRHVGDFIYHHTPAGTKVDILRPDGREGADGGADMSFYPLAIAMLNTRGCRVDLKRAPGVVNARRKRQGKAPIPGHYDVGAAEYITALRAASGGADRGGSHASPIPHLRRAHERELSDGRRVWVTSALVNVRSEGDIAFVERRAGYRNGQPGTR